jgi:hypothetical protein
MEDDRGIDLPRERSQALPVEQVATLETVPGRPYRLVAIRADDPPALALKQGTRVTADKSRRSRYRER